MGDDRARRDAILQAAIGVFLRYGFKKTSMDDLARAAGLSRQGLYLHFATKEALFKDVVLLVMAASRAASQAALARDALEIDERILGAFVALQAHSTAQMSEEHMQELFDTSEQLVGPALKELELALIADLARVIQSSGLAAKWKDAGLSARDLAQNLYATSHGAKHYVTTPAEYRERMRIAVRIVCRGGRR